MSLVLIGVCGAEALVVSDGAANETRADGTARRVANDRRKFREVLPGVIVAATGSGWAIEEQLFPSIAHFVRSAPAATFDDVVSFLARRLPDCHAADANRANASDSAIAPGLAVALVGFDHAAGCARMVMFRPREGYVPSPCGNGFYLMGGGQDATIDPALGTLIHRRLAAAWHKPTPFPAMLDVLRRIVREAAKVSSVIGGNVYACSVAPSSGP